MTANFVQKQTGHCTRPFLGPQPITPQRICHQQNALDPFDRPDYGGLINAKDTPKDSTSIVGDGPMPEDDFSAKNGSRDSPTFSRGAYDIIALAASAGGLRALSEVLAGLPRDFPAATVVVQHLDRRHRSLMAEILSRRTSLTVKEAKEGDRLGPGVVYIAPSDRHLLVNQDGTLSLSHSELVHFVRPSADLLFESVAASFKDRSIAVVLSGSGSDGSMGVKAVKKMGGTVIVQDEKSSEFYGMPGAALQTGSVDFVLPLEEIPSALVTLVVRGDVG
jgi:two-component system, chemotaxis family, protein-glutamate methylesterase/glutaminase